MCIVGGASFVARGQIFLAAPLAPPVLVIVCADPQVYSVRRRRAIHLVVSLHLVVVHFVVDLWGKICGHYIRQC